MSKVVIKSNVFFFLVSLPKFATENFRFYLLVTVLRIASLYPFFFQGYYTQRFASMSSTGFLTLCCLATRNVILYLQFFILLENPVLIIVVVTYWAFS